jgi:hypothetical protein
MKDDIGKYREKRKFRCIVGRNVNTAFVENNMMVILKP